MGYGPQQHAFQNGVNVFADRRGTTPTSGVIVVAAHYDTVEGSPGADDNASGVALVLELARLFAEQPTAMDVRFIFFDGEEQNMQGSKAFAMDADRLKNVRYVLVLEMLGTTCDTPHCQEWPEGTPDWMKPEKENFIAAVSLLEKTALSRALVLAQTPESPPVIAIPVPEQGLNWPHTRRSDHSVFWDRNIEAVMLTDTGDFRNPRYHSAADTADTIDWAYLSGAAGIAHTAVRHLANHGTTTQTASPHSTPSE